MLSEELTLYLHSAGWFLLFVQLPDVAASASFSSLGTAKEGLIALMSLPVSLPSPAEYPGGHGE